MKTLNLGHPVLAALLASLALGFIGPRSVSALGPAASQPRADFDARLPALAEDRGGFSLRSPKASQLARSSEVETRIPGLRLRWDGLSGSPSWVTAKPGEVLATPFPGEPEAAAGTFLRDQASLYLSLIHISEPTRLQV